MKADRVRLGDLCSVKTGAPMSRAKRLSSSDAPVTVSVLVPKAIEDARIADDYLVEETVSNVKDDLFTQEGDVVLKASTPYDHVYIDGKHTGLLVTSFGLILRKRPEANIDMRYLAAYFNMPQMTITLQYLSKGMTLQLLKKKDVEELSIPLPPVANQERLGRLFACVQERKRQCREVMEKSDLLLFSELSREIRDT